MKIKDYQPYSGFYDLREYKLPAKIFKKLWNIQDVLFAAQKDRKYLQDWNPGQWQRAQELSAKYQRILFGYPKKETL